MQKVMLLENKLPCGYFKNFSGTYCQRKRNNYYYLKIKDRKLHIKHRTFLKKTPENGQDIYPMYLIKMCK